MIHVIHGAEEFLRARRLAEIRERIGPADLLALNTTTLEGEKLSLNELQHAVEAVPFLCERRLVVVQRLLKRLGQRGRATKGDRADELSRLCALLDRLPETTELVFIEEEPLAETHPVLRHLAARIQSGEVRLHRCDAPSPRELPAWIRAHARTKGVEITGQAANALADAIGPNLRLIDTELEKLAVHAGRSGRITAQDVEALVPYVQTETVFRLTDAIAERRLGDAFALLYRMRAAGMAAPYLLTMMDRQFRILLQVQELAREGLSPAQIASRIRQREFVVKRALGQCRRWRPAELYAAFEHLLATDLAIKTGRIDEESALELLLITLLQRGLRSSATQTAPLSPGRGSAGAGAFLGL